MRVIHIEDNQGRLQAIFLDKIVYITYGEVTFIKLTTGGVECNLNKQQILNLIENSKYI